MFYGKYFYLKYRIQHSGWLIGEHAFMKILMMLVDIGM